MEQSSFMFQVIFPRPEYEKCESEQAEQDWLEKEERREKERKISDTKGNECPAQQLLNLFGALIKEGWRQKQRQRSSRLFGGKIYSIPCRTSCFASVDLNKRMNSTFSSKSTDRINSLNGFAEKFVFASR